MERRSCLRRSKLGLGSLLTSTRTRGCRRRSTPLGAAFASFGAAAAAFAAGGGSALMVSTRRSTGRDPHEKARKRARLQQNPASNRTICAKDYPKALKLWFSQCAQLPMRNQDFVNHNCRRTRVCRANEAGHQRGKKTRHRAMRCLVINFVRSGHPLGQKQGMAGANLLAGKPTCPE